MADNAPSLPQFNSGFRGIPTPDQLGMGMNPYKAAGLLRKVGKALNKPMKATVGAGTRGAGKSAVKSGSARASGVGRAAGGGKK